MEVGVDTDFIRGNPEHVLLGRPDEKPARRHGRQKARPITATTIQTDIKFRMALLKPIVEEYHELERATQALEGI
jgi:hypothetical protein